MNKEFYRSLLLLANDKANLDKLQEYALARINMHRDHLEKEKDPHRILEIQGAIAELRRFKTLRDEVLKGAE